MALALLFACVSIAYLLGSIPVGILVCRTKGLDPREVGSGRTGGTNVHRTAGLPAAVATSIGDILKGYLAVAIADQLFSWLGPAAPDAELVYPAALALSALGAIAGHNYSVFLGFSGGAGSSPNVGAALWFDPITFAVVLPVALVFLFVIRIASLASIAISLIVLTGISYRVYQGALPTEILIYAVGQLLFVFWALRPNIARLVAGTERRVELGRRKTGDREP